MTEHERRLTPPNREAVRPLPAVATVAKDRVLPRPDPQLQEQPPGRSRALGQPRLVPVREERIGSAVEVQPPPRPQVRVKESRVLGKSQGAAEVVVVVVVVGPGPGGRRHRRRGVDFRRVVQAVDAAAVVDPPRARAEFGPFDGPKIRS